MSGSKQWNNIRISIVMPCQTMSCFAYLNLLMCLWMTGNLSVSRLTLVFGFNTTMMAYFHGGFLLYNASAIVSARAQEVCRYTDCLSQFYAPLRNQLTYNCIMVHRWSQGRYTTRFIPIWYLNPHVNPTRHSGANWRYVFQQTQVWFPWDV